MEVRHLRGQALQPGSLVSRRNSCAPLRASAVKASSRRAPRRSWHRLGLCQAAVSTDDIPATTTESTNGATPKPADLPVYHGRGGRYTAKPRVVILGSGWGAMSLMKAMSQRQSEALDITLISPRNYFLYTALLPACATGTVEERSIVEPVRKVMGKKGTFFEASCREVDPVAKRIVVCCAPGDDMDETCFKIPYDILIMAVGSINNTFGIKGVQEHTMFFKNIDDANRLRRRMSDCFERASLPQASEEERSQLLSFIIVGGGPTGIEVAAELHDMVVDDLRRIYPDLIRLVRIRVIELMDHVLSTYDREISDYTAGLFSREGIDLVLNSRVASVERGAVTVVDTIRNKTEQIPFGACVWATGVAMHPLVKQLQAKLPEGSQTHFRSILTDQHCCVLGSEGSIYSIGDAATIQQEKALAHSEELFDAADTSKDGRLQLGELRDVLRKSSEQYSHFAEHARFLDGKYGGARRWNNMVSKIVKRRALGDAALESIDETTELDKEGFRELLITIDRGLRALPATAQVAKQQGEYLAGLLGKGACKPGQPMDGVKGFRYNHKGSLAYVGRDQAVMDIPTIGPLTGWSAGLAWKGFETYSQFSFRNLILVGLDWMRAKVFGRDISKV